MELGLYIVIALLSVGLVVAIWCFLAARKAHDELVLNFNGLVQNLKEKESKLNQEYKISRKLLNEKRDVESELNQKISHYEDVLRSDGMYDKLWDVIEAKKAEERQKAFDKLKAESAAVREQEAQQKRSKNKKKDSSSSSYDSSSSSSSSSWDSSLYSDYSSSSSRSSSSSSSSYDGGGGSFSGGGSGGDW